MHKSALGNGGTEGKEGQLHELEGLESQGDADDGDAADQPCEQVAQRHLPTEQERPNDVGYGVFFILQVDFLSKGGEGELGGLEALLAEGNADDGDAEQDAQKPPAQPQPQASENEPDDVCDGFHSIPP